VTRLHEALAAAELRARRCELQRQGRPGREPQRAKDEFAAVTAPDRGSEKSRARPRENALEGRHVEGPELTGRLSVELRALADRAAPMRKRSTSSRFGLTDTDLSISGRRAEGSHACLRAKAPTLANMRCSANLRHGHGLSLATTQRAACNCAARDCAIRRGAARSSRSAKHAALVAFWRGRAASARGRIRVLATAGSLPASSPASSVRSSFSREYRRAARGLCTPRSLATRAGMHRIVFDLLSVPRESRPARVGRFRVVRRAARRPPAIAVPRNGFPVLRRIGDEALSVPRSEFRHAAASCQLLHPRRRGLRAAQVAWSTCRTSRATTAPFLALAGRRDRTRPARTHASTCCGASPSRATCGMTTTPRFADAEAFR
jgi:hypothetical protein